MCWKRHFVRWKVVKNKSAINMKWSLTCRQFSHDCLNVHNFLVEQVTKCRIETCEFDVSNFISYNGSIVRHVYCADKVNKWIDYSIQNVEVVVVLCADSVHCAVPFKCFYFFFALSPVDSFIAVIIIMSRCTSWTLLSFVLKWWKWRFISNKC